MSVPRDLTPFKGNQNFISLKFIFKRTRLRAEFFVRFLVTPHIYTLYRYLKVKCMGKTGRVGSQVTQPGYDAPYRGVNYRAVSEPVIYLGNRVICRGGLRRFVRRCESGRSGGGGECVAVLFISKGGGCVKSNGHRKKRNFQFTTPFLLDVKRFFIPGNSFLRVLSADIICVCVCFKSLFMTMFTDELRTPSAARYEIIMWRPLMIILVLHENFFFLSNFLD